MCKGGKCPQKHDPAQGSPHKSKDTNSEMPKDMKGIMTRLAQLEAAAQTNIFSGPSAAVEQTTSRDILSIPERTKRTAEAAGVTSYVQLGSSVRSGAARAEFTGIVIDADTFAQLGERDSVQQPCCTESLSRAAQESITITNDNTGASEIQQEEIYEVVPEIYHMLQSDNAFDDVELQDPLIVIRGNDIILRVHGGEVIDGNHMWNTTLIHAQQHYSE
jgi:hypothetical protein